MRTRQLLSAFALSVVAATPAASQQIVNPDAAYLAATTLLPITAPDFDDFGSVSNGPFTVSFADAVNAPVNLNARTVPDTWASWSMAPNSEDTDGVGLRVGFNVGSTFLRFLSNRPVSIFGFEAEPEPFAVLPMTANFFRGGVLVGTVTRDVDGEGGARLFAFQAEGGIDRVDFSSTEDFAVAFIRVGPAATVIPEPATVALVGAGLAAVGVMARRRAVRA